MFIITARKRICEGYVFICQSFCSQGGGACVGRGGMHGWGLCMGGGCAMCVGDLGQAKREKNQLNLYLKIITARQRSCGKVMFSQCLSVYRGGVGGTNPTGMLCSYENFAQLTIQCNNWISAHMLVDCGG